MSILTFEPRSVIESKYGWRYGRLNSLRLGR